MPVECGGEQVDMFFIAYTLDNVEDKNDRPITFAFNGGPGSSSSYINFGCYGPRRVELDEKGSPVSMPARIVDNENSLLDMTDLVFIDPVGTGYSRPVNPQALDKFTGYDNDLKAMGEFIRLYVNRYDRWGSEKYLSGESYGTTRAVGLCDYLRNTFALDVNGLILLSAINDYTVVYGSEGNGMSYLLTFPRIAADAWYHEALAGTYQDMELEAFVDEVREFVSTQYLYGIFMGDRLSEEEKDELAERISGYCGLTKETVLKKNLRISLEDFRMELLSDENLALGRFDGRVTGPKIQEGTDTDPSSSDIDIAFGNTFIDYVTKELEYRTEVPYIPLSYEVIMDWEGVTRPRGGEWISQEKTLYACMARNKFLKIWVVCGYYDGATPFYASEWVYSHVFLNRDMKKNLQFTYYPSGHMFYVDRNSFDQFRLDAEKWFGR